MALSDPEGFVARWVPAQRLIAAFLSAMIPNTHEAEDILQDVASAALRKFAEFDRNRPFAAWAIGIARNEVLNHRRKKATARVIFSDEVTGALSEAYSAMSDESDLIHDALRECLKQVSGRSRVALDLRYVEDLKPGAIAEKMTLSDVAARVLLNRARAALRDCIRRKIALTA